MILIVVWALLVLAEVGGAIVAIVLGSWPLAALLAFGAIVYAAGLVHLLRARARAKPSPGYVEHHYVGW